VYGMALFLQARAVVAPVRCDVRDALRAMHIAMEVHTNAHPIAPAPSMATVWGVKACSGAGTVSARVVQRRDVSSAVYEVGSLEDRIRACGACVL
jgi:hypothetical protein